MYAFLQAMWTILRAAKKVMTTKTSGHIAGIKFVADRRIPLSTSVMVNTLVRTVANSASEGFAVRAVLVRANGIVDPAIQISNNLIKIHQWFAKFQVQAKGVMPTMPKTSGQKGAQAPKKYHPTTAT